MPTPKPYENPLAAEKVMQKLYQIVQEAVNNSPGAQSLTAEQKNEAVNTLVRDLMEVRKMAGPQKVQELLAPANKAVLAEGYVLAAKDKRFDYLVTNKALIALTQASPNELRASLELQRIVRDFKLDYMEKNSEDKQKSEHDLMKMQLDFSTTLDKPLMANSLFQTIVCDALDLKKNELDFGKKAEPIPELEPKSEFISDLDKTLEAEFGTRGQTDVHSEVAEVVQVAGVERTEGGVETLAEISEESQEAKLDATAKEKAAADLAANADEDAKKEAATLAEEATDELEDAAEDLLIGKDETDEEEPEIRIPNWPPRPVPGGNTHK